MPNNGFRFCFFANKLERPYLRFHFVIFAFFAVKNFNFMDRSAAEPQPRNERKDDLTTTSAKRTKERIIMSKDPKAHRSLFHQSVTAPRASLAWPPDHKADVRQQRNNCRQKSLIARGIP